MTDLAGIQHALGDAATSLSGLASLLPGGLSQHTRLLRLHTVLGADALLAECVTIEEGLVPAPAPASPAACRIELLALSTQAKLQAADLLGQPVLVELLTSGSLLAPLAGGVASTAPGGAWRPFHGHVTRFERIGSDGGLTRYRLHIEPWLSCLGHRTDAWVFQDMSVLDITEAVLADHRAQGALQPAWRIDVADRAAFPRRSLCTQFHETDLAFLTRLWAEEGLFAWFEHEGAPSDEHLGRHILVLADHNAAFRPNAQARIRYTQAGATLKEDALQQWDAVRSVGASALHTASWDHRAVSNHGATEHIAEAHGQPFALAHTDHPGHHAFESPCYAARRARLQREALEAARKLFEGAGTVRTLAPGSTFTLLDHPEHPLSDGEQANTFAVLSVVHTARNNVEFQGSHSSEGVRGSRHGGSHGGSHGSTNDSNAPLYEARVTAQRQSVPVRRLPTDARGRIALGKPLVHGTQTAIVVGDGEPVHTDRDGRIKVQFHWQRGAHASHRLSHPTGGCNAPASAAVGTWVRVAQGWAGQNWGTAFIPRLGQEVVVTFLDGDIDRPVVIGAACNGQGQPNGPGNLVDSGAATATGNAPAWFPGDQQAGKHEGHAHASTLSGLRSQSLDSSQAGGGAHNQLVMDDTAGQGRVWLHTTQAQTWLQIGHLLQQDGNQRLQPRGHGLELHTQAQGALRAARGLHLSTHARPGGTTSRAQPMDTREAEQQLQAHADLLQALHANAQAHRAKLPGEAAPERLPARQALGATLYSLQATGGGEDRIDTLARPDLVLSARGDIASTTPANTLVATGANVSLTTGQDANLLAQRHQAWAVKDGIGLFTRGEAKNTQRAVQATGMQLHAASGNVRTEAQSGPFTLTAQKAVDLQSTAADIVITAPERIVLNGGGGYVKIEGGNIEIGTGGAAQFNASAKELAGGEGASGNGPALNKAKDLFDEQFVLKDQDTAVVLAGTPYRIENNKGEVVATGITDANGRTSRVASSKAETLKVFWGQ
jgi:type VI secretion system secreted protein VgrG